MKCVSPRYNPNGWLCVKKKKAYLPTCQSLCDPGFCILGHGGNNGSDGGVFWVSLSQWVKVILSFNHDPKENKWPQVDMKTTRSASFRAENEKRQQQSNICIACTGLLCIFSVQGKQHRMQQRPSGARWEQPACLSALITLIFSFKYICFRAVWCSRILLCVFCAPAIGLWK